MVWALGCQSDETAVMAAKERMSVAEGFYQCAQSIVQIDALDRRPFRRSVVAASLRVSSSR